MAGHAYGCWIARAAAQARPDLISGLILIAAGAGSWPVELSRAIEVAMDSDRARQDRLDALRLAFFADGHDPSHWLTGWHPDLVAMQRAARQRTDRASWWPSGIAPILDIIGLADPFRPEGDLVERVEQRRRTRAASGDDEQAAAQIGRRRRLGSGERRR